VEEFLGGSVEKDSGELLGQIDPEKRDFVGKLIRTTVLAAPMVASFSLAAVTEAEAQVANGSLPT
jgi:hypothetical protein